MSFPKRKPPHNIRVLHGWLGEYARRYDQHRQALEILDSGDPTTNDR